MARGNRETIQEYNRQRRRIKQFIRRAESRGYQFKDNIIPERPENITKASVRRLARLTPDVLYSKALYGGLATYGEVVSAKEGRKAERSAAAKKAAETRRSYMFQEPTQERTNTPGFMPPENIISDDSFYDDVTISQYKVHIARFRKGGANLLRGWLDRIIAEHGKHDTAIMLNRGAENGLIITWAVAYDRDTLFNYMSEMLNYLPEAGAFFKEELMEAMEEEEAFESYGVTGYED